MKLITLILTASLGLAAAPGAWAVVVISDNTTQPFNSDNNARFSDENRWAAAFATDGQAYDLKSVTLWKLRNDNPTAAALMDIYTSTGAGVGVPGTLVGAMTSPGSVGNSFSPAVFTTAGLGLAANSRYWVVCRTTGDAIYDWGFTTSTSGSGAGFVAARSESTDFGATWNSTDTEAFLMKVEADAAAVPEPSQWAMMGLTLLGAVVWAARQRQAKAKVG